MLDEKIIRKHRAKSSSSAILIMVEQVELDNLISDLFLNIKDEEFKKFLERYEKMLLLAKVNPSKFTSSYYIFLKDNSREIKRKNLFKKFLDFKLEIETMYQLKEINIYVLNAFLSMLMAQIEYIQPLGKTICGIDEKGKFMFIPEPYMYLDYPLIEYELNYGRNNGIDQDTFRKIARRYGYSLENYDYDNSKSMVFQERYVSNMYSYMCNFINNNTYDILPVPYADIPPYFNTTIRTYLNSNEYKDMLLKRVYMLPKDGVLVKTSNVNNIQSILFKEIVVNNIPYMIYKIELTKNKYISGYYNINNQLFTSPWSLDPWDLVTSKSNSSIENFVLEVYSYLTTDIDITNPYGLKVVRDIDNYINFEEGIPYIEVFIKDKKINDIKPNKSYVKHLDKTKFVQIEKTIDYYIRKLPIGESASEDAKEQARKYGYELKPNETFVRTFTKKVNIKK